MASGDTKTEALLNILGNGGTGDEYRGSGNTKTQNYILDAIDRINSLDPGGGGSGETTHKLSTDDYNYNMASGSATAPYDCVALWLLPAGVYEVPDNNVKAYCANTNLYRANKGTYICGGKGTNGTGIISLNAEHPSTGAYYAGRVYVDSPNGNPKGTIYLGALAQETGNSAMDAMSQKAVTDAINKVAMTTFFVDGNTYSPYDNYSNVPFYKDSALTTKANGLDYYNALKYGNVNIHFVVPGGDEDVISNPTSMILPPINAGSGMFSSTPRAWFVPSYTEQTVVEFGSLTPTDVDHFSIQYTTS